MSRQRKLRGLTKCGPAAVVVMTLAAMALLGTGPAPASATVGGHLRQGTPATARQARATVNRASGHNVNAPCNARPKPGHMQCFAIMHVPGRSEMSPAAGGPPPTALTPADIQSAYSLPSATAGSGQTVAIVDAYGDSNAESDLAAWRAHYGLPPCTTANGCFQKVDQNGGTNYPANDQGWAIETSLDLDAVSAACPNCHILLVEGNDSSGDSLGIAENTAVSMGAKFVSNSYGEPENTGETLYDSYYEHPGVMIGVATGDSGWADGTGQGADYPAAIPDVTAVGGTTLTQDGSVPRGWDEAAWARGGSGCSLFEPQPSWQSGISQLTTACPGNRAIADISADADPNSGIAIYDTLGYGIPGLLGPWAQFGGTSLATPLVTAMYALAGTPAAGSSPVTYPYQDPNQSADLNDITTGTNGPCGSVLCETGPGWDGPTGLGTPNGIGALNPNVGVISGQLTAGAGGAPIAGAVVTAGSFSASTNAAGDYTMSVLPGSYTMTATAYGYARQTVSGVQASARQTTTENFAMVVVPFETLSGTVKDGSGHGYPLYAKITIKGYSGGSIYTSPSTGKYSVSLPGQNDYSLTVTPVYPGYKPVATTAAIGTAATVKNVSVRVDPAACDAPGYAPVDSGAAEGFTGWTGTTPQDGWTNVDNSGTGQVWQFGADPTKEGLPATPPGSDGQFAIMDSQHYAAGGPGTSEDTSLVSPVVNLTGMTKPVISFGTVYAAARGAAAKDQTARVDLSLDGGTTWTTVWQRTVASVRAQVTIPITQAAGQADAQVRFHFTTINDAVGRWWSLDNVLVGTRTCTLTPGGYVDGVVTDGNTGKPVNGATVASQPNPGQAGTSAANPADVNLANGFYWLFASPPGTTQFSIAPPADYAPAAQTVTVPSNGVITENWTLQAGELTVSPGSVSVSQPLGGSQTQQVSVTNNGTEPAQVDLTAEDGGVTPMTRRARRAGAPLEQIKAHVLLGAMLPPAHQHATPGRMRPVPRYDAAWGSIANYPTPIAGNAVAYDGSTGDVYSVGGNSSSGTSGDTVQASGYVYSPASAGWSRIASTPQPVEDAASGFLDGTMYIAGGVVIAGGPGAYQVSSALYAYDAVGNRWVQKASLPAQDGVYGAAGAVLNGRLYVVGGCTDYLTPYACDYRADTVYSYNPATNAWTQLASYPAPVAYPACAGIGNDLVCAGGASGGADVLDRTYIYHPGSNTWSQGADMPYDDFGMAYSGSGGMLQIVGGATDQGMVITNRAEQYDPATDTWSALPNAPAAEYLGGGACGLYQIGGATGPSESAVENTASVLPGYSNCGSSAVSWLSASPGSFTLAPGQSQTVTLTLNAAALSQPGTYAAGLAISSNTPYDLDPVAVSMQVTPPATWGKLTGRVTDAATGNPIPGATVQICAGYDTTTGSCSGTTWTLATGPDGTYQLWLPAADSPLRLVATMDGYQSAIAIDSITQGATTTQNFALTSAG